MNKRYLIGSKFLGFNFKDRLCSNDRTLGFNDSMLRLIDKELEIVGYNEEYDSFYIMEKSNTWHFPASEVMERLIEVDEEKIFNNLDALFKKIKNS